ncbi:metallophosphoesterase [Aidingimonas lacisalsi]|uniref:metallophosphoesterase n=1 Tax=Aidingimonas lacisalsi TaxID=2604086 RepID=UPI001F1696CF|nr:metallophosphoesterase [Aidingimonas lacisalsi]
MIHQIAEKNMQGRDFVVSDIHGQYGTLMDELGRVDFDGERDRLFSVGDLIDRGAESYRCLSLLFEPWFFAVRGNHEMLAYQALHEKGGPDYYLWLENGGTWVFQEDPSAVKQVLERAMQHLPYAREVPIGKWRVGIVHAEAPSDWSDVSSPDEALQQRMVWGRSRIERRDTRPITGIDTVVVGHTIVRQPVWLGNVLYIDTGAFLTGKLTLLSLDDIVNGRIVRD